MSLYEIIKALQNASGNLAKTAILEANRENELFKAYMKAVYDVGISYYATKLPTGVTPGNLATMDQEYLDWLTKAVRERVFVGNAGKALLKVTLATFDAEGGELFQYIIKRSIGASVGDTMVLDTWPGLYFIPPYMRCSSMSEKAREQLAKEDSFYVQVKRDGSFAYLNPGRVCTRQGSCYPDWFVGTLTAGMGNNEVLVGEMEVYQRESDNAAKLVLMSRKEGNGVLNSILQGADENEFAGYQFKYVAWDCLSLGEFEAGRSDRPYERRLKELEISLSEGLYSPSIELVENWEVKSVAEAKRIHTGLTARGLEGSVWKRKQGIWKDTSSGTIDAVKVKVVAEAEFVVTGYYEGKGKDKGALGGLSITTRCGKMKCNVGSGFSGKQRKEIWEAILRGETPEGWIITAEFNDITTARGKDTVSLSLPIFIEQRFDRTEADTLERVYEQFEAAKQGK